MRAPTAEQLAIAPWMRYARAEIGVREMPGAANSPRVLEYLSACKGPRRMLQLDSTAWCSAFANWTLARCSIAGTGSLAARSWLLYGDRIEQRAARYGDLVVFWRGLPIPAGVINAPGHVGFLDRIVGNQVWTLGGNQGDCVSVAARPLRELLAFRRPSLDELSLYNVLRGER